MYKIYFEEDDNVFCINVVGYGLEIKANNHVSVKDNSNAGSSVIIGFPWKIRSIEHNKKGEIYNSVKR